MKDRSRKKPTARTARPQATEGQGAATLRTTLPEIATLSGPFAGPPAAEKLKGAVPAPPFMLPGKGLAASNPDSRPAIPIEVLVQLDAEEDGVAFWFQWR